MYRVLIVDDEPLTRLAIRHLIAAMPLPLTVAGEAADGMEALETLERRGPVDILITDIRMPRLGGVELLREWSARQSRGGESGAAIVLSAFNDYEYVRQAFLHGALDYILKADLDEAHLRPLLERAIAVAAAGQDRHGPQTAEAEGGAASTEAASDHREFDEARLASAARRVACGGEAQAGSNDWKLMQTELGEANLVAAYIRLERDDLDDVAHGFLRQTILSALEEGGVCRIVWRIGNDAYAALCSVPRVPGVSAVRERLQAAFGSVRIRLAQFANVKASFGISSVTSGAEGWPLRYREAERLAGLSYTRGAGHLFFPDQADSLRRALSTLRAEWPAAQSAVARALEQPDAAEWRQAYVRMTELLEQAGGTAEDIRPLLEELLWEVGSLLYRRTIRWERCMEGNAGASHPIDQLRQWPTLGEAAEQLRQLLARVHKALHSDSGQPAVYSLPIAKAKSYIDAHFREDVGLALISDRVGVSESYFSKQFAKEVGVGFVQYVTQLRLAEAKRLMETGMRIQEVAESVGYVNPEHFSRLFKKVTGVSPKAYRQER